MVRVGRSVRRALGVGLCGLVTFVPLKAQVESSEQLAESFGELFVDVISVAGGTAGECRLDVYLQTSNEGLSFVKHGNLYDASFEVTVTILDSASVMVGEKSWNEEVKGVDFDESVSPNNYKLLQRVFPVKPGRYTVTVAIRDNESKVTRKATRRAVAPAYGTLPFMLSDIMLLNRVTEVAGKKSIVPQVSHNVGNIPDQFSIFFEAYNDRGLDSVRYILSAIDAKGDTKREQDTTLDAKKGRNEKILPFRHAELPIGDYRLVLRAYIPHVPIDSVESLLAVSTRSFSVRWGGLPRNVKDIDVAIDQLRYIAKDDELSYMKEGKDAEEKQNRFKEFWKKRDPNPNTPRNEKMEKYYSRIEYANKHFTHYLDGWKTDMGMIYIIYGPPNDVSRHPFEVDSKPYEVWRYYDLNYDFVFVDETGFGDYRLITPLYDVRKRPGDW